MEFKLKNFLELRAENIIKIIINLEIPQILKRCLFKACQNTIILKEIH